MNLSKVKKNTVTGTLIPHQQSNLLLEYDMYFKVKNLYFCKDIRLRAYIVKFEYSEKATKFEKIFHLKFCGLLRISEL